MKRTNHAITRSQIARKARPLGEFIANQIHAKAGSPPPVPRVGASRSVPVVCQTGEQRRSDREAGQTREAPVLHDCLRWLHQRGVFAWRQNTGTAWIGNQPVSFGYPGAADITGILPDGRRLEIECKSATGKQSDKQKKFQQRVEESGGVYLLVRSVEELSCGIQPYLSSGNAMSN